MLLSPAVPQAARSLMVGHIRAIDKGSLIHQSFWRVIPKFRLFQTKYSTGRPMTGFPVQAVTLCFLIAMNREAFVQNWEVRARHLPKNTPDSRRNAGFIGG